MSPKTVKVALIPVDDPTLRGIAIYFPRQGNPPMILGSPEEADIIFCTSKVTAGEKLAEFKGQKKIVMVPNGRNGNQLKSLNAELHVLDTKSVTTELKRLGQLVAGVTPEPQKEAPPVTEAVAPIGKYRLLIVDDSPRCILGVSEQLDDYSKYDLNITIATTFEGAMELLAAEHFDVVITELCMQRSKNDDQSGVYGLHIMLEAVRRGAERVVVYTDLDASAAVFIYADTHHFGSARVHILDARGLQNMGKDWVYAVDTAMGE